MRKEMDENSSKNKAESGSKCFQSDTCEEIFEKYKLMQKYKSKISINTVKIYIDSVVENKRHIYLNHMKIHVLSVHVYG